MNDIKNDLGVQSYCFRKSTDNAAVVEKLQQLGLNKVELYNRHIGFDDESNFDKVIDTYRAGGVEIVSLGVQRMANDPATEEKYFRFVQQAGAKFMAVDFDIDTTPQSYRTAERLADKYDIKLCIHNHGAKHWLGNSQTLAHVFKNTSVRIGLCLDTAWCLDSHEDPIQWVEKFADRLYGVHIKDFIFDRTGKSQDVVVGEGNLDLPRLKSTLESINYGGYVVLEYEGDVDNPDPALAQCVAKVQAL